MILQYNDTSFDAKQLSANGSSKSCICINGECLYSKLYIIAYLSCGKRSISWCNLCKHQPSNLPEKRFTTLLSNEEISCLPDESEDILKKNMLDQYMGRPD